MLTTEVFVTLFYAKPHNTAKNDKIYIQLKYLHIIHIYIYVCVFFNNPLFLYLSVLNEIIFDQNVSFNRNSGIKIL